MCVCVLVVTELENPSVLIAHCSIWSEHHDGWLDFCCCCCFFSFSPHLSFSFFFPLSFPLALFFSLSLFLSLSLSRSFLRSFFPLVLFHFSTCCLYRGGRSLRDGMRSWFFLSSVFNELRPQHLVPSNAITNWINRWLIEFIPAKK